MTTKAKRSPANRAARKKVSTENDVLTVITDTGVTIGAGGDPSTASVAYYASLPEWILVRDLMAGASAVRAKGECYLPRYAEETDASYKARVETAPFVNHFRDKLETIVAKPFSRDVILQGEVTPKLRELSEDIDGQGTSLHKFARETFKEGIGFGVVGILVDYPDVKPGSTLADERNLGGRPYWVMYRAEDILALYTEIRGGRRFVTHLRLREDTVRRYGSFMERPVRRVRILNDDPLLGRTWELWESGFAGWELIGSGAITLSEIPFRLFRPGEREWWANSTVPNLIDLAYLQVYHYQNESNLQHVLQLAGFPMLAGNGINPPVDPVTGQPILIKIGPGVVCYAPAIASTSTIPSWTFIEPKGDSIRALQDKIDKIEAQMAEIGKAPLVRDHGGVTATTDAINAAKAHAAAEAWAIDLKDVLEQMYVFTCEFIKEQAEPDVYIHTDFGVELRESQENTELMLACQNNLLSRDTLWDEWRRRAFLGPQFDPDRERELIVQQQAEADARTQMELHWAAIAGGGAARSGKPPQLTGGKAAPGAGKPKQFAGKDDQQDGSDLTFAAQ